MWEKAQWIVGDTPKMWKVHDGKPWLSIFVIPKILESIFRGFSQVCFANNSWSGFFVLIGLFLANPFVGLAALLGSVASLAMSKILDQPDTLVVAGILNYSAVLVGTVTISLFPVFFEGPISLPVWCLIFVMGAISVCMSIGMDEILNPLNLPVYTLPFNIVTSILFLTFQSAGFPVHNPNAVNVTLGPTTIEWGKVFEGTLKSAGQVYAVEDSLCSIFIIVGLLINSPLLAFMSIVGALLSSLIGILITTPPYSAVYAGLWGYNGFLAAGCLVFLVYPNWLSILVSLINAVFSTFVQSALIPVFAVSKLPVLTFPFCISSLVFVAMIPSIPGLERVNDLTFPEYHFWKKRRETKSAQRVARNDDVAENYSIAV